MREPDSTGARADFEGGIGALEYWRIVVDRRAIVLACLGVCVAATMLFTFLTPPEYQATTTLQIGRQAPEILTFQDILRVDPMAYRDFYQTQYRILQSRATLRIASERLDLVNRPELLSRKGSPLMRVYGALKSWFEADGEQDDRQEDRAIDFLEKGLSVAPVRNSQLVKLSFLDREPELAADATNAVADAYQQFSLERRYTTTEQASEFLTKEVARLQSEIEEREHQLQAYGREKAIWS